MNKKEFYEILQKDNFNSDMTFDTLQEAINFLKNILKTETNYNYNINKNNAYSLYKVIYNDSNDYYDYYEILPEITIKQYYDMSYEDKEKYFNNI